jgi:hypothetical protein
MYVQTVSKLPDVTFLYGLILLNTAKKINPDLPICELNVRRLYLVAAMLGSKV